MSTRLFTRRDDASSEESPSPDEQTATTAPPTPSQKNPSSKMTVFFHRLVVLARVGLAWTAGALAARKFSSIALAPAFAVAAHFCLECLFCRGPARRFLLLVAVLLATSDLRAFFPLVCVGLGTFLGLLLLVNADAGAGAAVASAALAAAPRRSLLLFFTVLVLLVAIAPANKFIILKLRGQSWLDRGEWPKCEYELYRRQQRRRRQSVSLRQSTTPPPRFRGDEGLRSTRFFLAGSSNNNNNAKRSRAPRIDESDAASGRDFRRSTVFSDDEDVVGRRSRPSLIARYQPPRSPSPRRTGASS